MPASLTRAPYIGVSSDGPRDRVSALHKWQPIPSRNSRSRAAKKARAARFTAQGFEVSRRLNFPVLGHALPDDYTELVPLIQRSSTNCRTHESEGEAEIWTDDDSQDAERVHIDSSGTRTRSESAYTGQSVPVRRATRRQGNLRRNNPRVTGLESPVNPSASDCTGQCPKTRPTSYSYTSPGNNTSSHTSPDSRSRRSHIIENPNTSRAEDGRPISTALVKHVPLVPGIPVAPAPGGFSKPAVICFVFFIVSILLQLVFVFHAYVIHDRFELPTNSTTLISVRNCNILFTAAKGASSYIETRAWRDTPRLPKWSILRVLNNGASGDPYSATWMPNDECPRSIQRTGPFSTPPSREDCRRKEFRLEMLFSGYRTFFQCTVHFHLAPNHTFSNLAVKLSNSEQLMSIEAKVPLRAMNSIDIEALHGLVQLKDLHTPTVDVMIGDGELYMVLSDPTMSHTDETGTSGSTGWMTNNFWWQLIKYWFEQTQTSHILSEELRLKRVSILSQTATVSVLTAIPLRVSISGALASRSIFRAAGLWIAGGTASAPSGGAVEALVYPSSYNAASAELNAATFTMKSPGAYLKISAETEAQQHLRTEVAATLAKDPSSKTTFNVTGPVAASLAIPAWVGVKNLAQPAIVNDLSELVNFIKADQGSPWAAELKILGQRTTRHGAWRLLSSSAYYRANIWFTLLSGGMLTPRMRSLYLSVSGLFCHEKPASRRGNGTRTSSSTAARRKLFESDPLAATGGLPLASQTPLFYVPQFIRNKLKNSPDVPVFTHSFPGTDLPTDMGTLWQMWRPRMSSTEAFNNQMVISNAGRSLPSRQPPSKSSAAFIPRLRTTGYREAKTSLVSNSVMSQQQHFLVNVDPRAAVGNAPLLEASDRIVAEKYLADREIFSRTPSKNVDTQSLAVDPAEIKHRRLVDTEVDNLIGAEGDEFTDSSNNTSGGEKQSGRSILRIDTDPEALADAFPGLRLGPVLPEEMCEADLLDDIFLAMQRTPIGPILQSSASFRVEWAQRSQATGHVFERIFRMKNGVVFSPLLKRVRDSTAFFCAVVINGTAGFVVAWKVLSYIISNANSYLLRELKDRQLLRATSHRLNHEVTEYEGFDWNVLACRVYYPTHGFVLLWNQRRTARSPGRLAVQIKPVITHSTTTQLNLTKKKTFGISLKRILAMLKVRMLQPAARFLGGRWLGLDRIARKLKDVAADTDMFDLDSNHRGFSGEVFLYIPYSDVNTCRSGTQNQKELFIPMRYPTGSHAQIKLDTNQRYHLDPKQNYRIRVLSLNTAGRVVERSTWSPEVRPEGSTSFIDMALVVLQLVCPSRQSSLDQFLEKYTIESTGFRIPTRLYNLSLMLAYDAFHCPELRSSNQGGFEQNPGKVSLRNRRLGGRSPGGNANVSTRYHQEQQLAPSQQGSQQTAVMDMARRRVTLAVFFGRTAQAAREDRERSGHRVYSSLHIDARPRLRVINGPGGEERYLELKPLETAELFLERCRISQTAICFEVSETSTGQVLANGSTRFDEMEVVVGLKKNPNIGIFHCFLFNTAGGGSLWGRVLGSLDVTGFLPYVRHEPPLRDLVAAGLTPSVSNLHSLPSTSLAGHRSTTRRRTRSNSKLVAIAAALETISSHKRCDDETALVGAESNDPHLFLHPERTRSRKFGDPDGGFYEDETGPIFTRAVSISNLCFLESGVAPSNTRCADQPGRSILQGASMVLQWRWVSSDRPPNVYLHLLDHWTNEYLTSVQWGHSIPNMGVHSWVADMEFAKDECSRCVYFVMTLEPWSALPGHQNPYAAQRLSPLNRVFVLAQSNAFFMVKALPLCELEMAYAAFCRTHGLEMEHLSETVLESHDFLVHEAQLRVCQNLRRPLPFEDDDLRYVHCNGQCIVSSTSKMVMYRKKEVELTDSAYASANGNGADLLGVVTTAKPSDSLEETKLLEVYKSVSLRLKVVENCRVDQDRYNWLAHPSNFLISMDLNYGSCLVRYVTRVVSSVPGVPRLQRFLLELSHRRFFLWCIRAKLHQAYLLVLPTAVGSLLFLFQIVTTCSFPLFGAFLVALHTYLLKSLEMETHSTNSPEYISDLLFDFSWSFIIRMPPLFLLVAGICLLQTFLMFFIVVFGSELRREKPRLFQEFDKLGSFLSLISLFMFLWIFAMFLLWFILGALINSEAILPYAVMLGSAVALSYAVWTNFASARRWVKSYIEENLELLLSVALNNFFESANLTFNKGGRELILSDSRLLTFRDKIKEEIREKRNAARRAYQLERLEELEKMSLTSAGALGDCTFSTWARKKREKICTLFFEKIVPTQPNKFYFNEHGRPMGFEQERARLSVGARLASAAEVEANSARVEDLLKGGDVAMLRDGVKHGPRFGYILTKGPQRGRDFNFAIVALPRYPRPEEIPVDLKLDMIFDNFNVIGDDYLDSKEFETLALTLDKKQFQNQSWEETCALLSYDFDVDIDPEHGIHRRELGRIYDKIDDLDRDFQLLFPSAPEDFEEDLMDLLSDEGLNSSNELDGRSDGFEWNDQFGGFESGFQGDNNETGGSEDDSSDERDDALMDMHDDNVSDDYNDDSDDEEYIRKTLMTNSNARKLQSVFNYFTQHYRARSTDEIISDVGYVSSKIVESHFTILFPIFGKESVLGLHSSSSGFRRTSSVPMTTSRIALSSPEDEGLSITSKPHVTTMNITGSPGNTSAVVTAPDRLSVILKSLHLELERDIVKLFRALFQQTFDPVAVRNGVVNFCDNVWPQKIQTRASRLTNAQLELSLSELHQESRLELLSPPLKTAYQVVTLVRQYQISLTDEIRDVLAICNRSKRSDLEVPVGIVTRLLVAAGVLGKSEVQEQIVEINVGVNRTRRVVMSRPRVAECYHLLVRYVERHVGSNQAARVSVDHLIATVRSIVTDHLWFSAFKMLVRLLGVDLTEDEFPGSAVDVELDGASSELSQWLDEAYKNALPTFCHLDPASLRRTLSNALARGQGDSGSGMENMVCEINGIAEFKCDALGANLQQGPNNNLTEIELEAMSELTHEQRMRLKRNLLRMKRVFDQLSNGSGFLAVDLADEAMLLLSDTRMHVASVISCLQHLGVGGTSMVGPTPPRSFKGKSYTSLSMSPTNLSSGNAGSGCHPAHMASSALLGTSGTPRGKPNGLSAQTGPVLSLGKHSQQLVMSPPKASVMNRTVTNSWDQNQPHLSGLITSGSVAVSRTGMPRTPHSNPGEQHNQVSRLDSCESPPNRLNSHIQNEFTAAAVLEMLGVQKDVNIIDIDTAVQRDFEHFDWSHLRADAELRSGNLSREFNRVATRLHGFMGKSQIVEFVKELQRLHFKKRHCEKTDGVDTGSRRLMRSNCTSWREEDLPPPLDTDLKDTTSATDTMHLTTASGNEHQTKDSQSGRRLHVGFELFHRGLQRIGLSVSLSHSRILWALVSSSLTPQQTFEQMLPVEDIARAIVLIYLQPRNTRGEPILPMHPEESVATYHGYLTFHSFKRLLRIISCLPNERGARNMWDDLEKDPMEISDFLPPELFGDRRRLYFMRLDIDKLGLDPTKGRVVKIDTIQRQLPKLLMTGLSHEAVRVLLQLLLQLNVNDCRLTEVLDGLSKKTNRYSLIKPEDVGTMLSSLSVEGMSFPMLRDLMSKMRLDFPVQDVKRMFDLMDLNNDKSLSLLELLGGFEVLFGKFLPEYICEAVNVTVTDQAYTTFIAVLGLLTFFGFLALAFSAFTGVRTGMSTVVQSIFALVGAFGLQNQASQDMENVRATVRTRIEQLFGDKITDKSGAIHQQQMPAKAGSNATIAMPHFSADGFAQHQDPGRPMKLRYSIPKRFHPELDDPRPCVTFPTGSEVNLEPIVSGRCLKETLKWSIMPRLPPRLGLHFDERTGSIRGQIPLPIDGERDFRMPRRTFDIMCRNHLGGAKCKVTFQVLPRSSRTMLTTASGARDIVTTGAGSLRNAIHNTGSTDCSADGLGEGNHGLNGGGSGISQETTRGFNFNSDPHATSSHADLQTSGFIWGTSTARIPPPLIGKEGTTFQGGGAAPFHNSVDWTSPSSNTRVFGQRGVGGKLDQSTDGCSSGIRLNETNGAKGIAKKPNNRVISSEFLVPENRRQHFASGLWLNSVKHFRRKTPTRQYRRTADRITAPRDLNRDLQS